MTSPAAWRRGERATKRATANRRRWACPECTQTRITPLDTRKAPICPSCRRPMTKGRRVSR
jgi:uncharacterized paraquat-inducible protein A